MIRHRPKKMTLKEGDVGLSLNTCVDLCNVATILIMQCVTGFHLPFITAKSINMGMDAIIQGKNGADKAKPRKVEITGKMPCERKAEQKLAIGC